MKIPLSQVIYVIEAASDAYREIAIRWCRDNQLEFTQDAEC